jgi:cytochrome c-type biogenesis protein CcmE
MKPRHKKIIVIAIFLVSIAVAAGLVLKAFSSNLVFFFTPTQIANNEAPKNKNFRIGGLVVVGSLKRSETGVDLEFFVTDTAKQIRVTYDGILPDLFKEGKGVVAEGKLDSNGDFHAESVLAKHDENYMPPEAADALKRANNYKEEKQ